MSIADEIQDLNTNLTAAKAAVTAKGGTVGDTGLAGLADEIAGIPSGGGGSVPVGSYGKIAFYKDVDLEYPSINADGCTVEIVDSKKAAEYYVYRDDDGIILSYAGSDDWAYVDGNYNDVYYTTSELLSLMGISVSNISQDAYIRIWADRVIDYAGEEKQVSLDSASDLNALCFEIYGSLADLKGNHFSSEQVSKLVLGSSVTSVPDHFASNFSNLKYFDASLATNFTTVGDDCFVGIPADMHLPTVTTVGDYSFCYCHGEFYLANVTTAGDSFLVGNHFNNGTGFQFWHLSTVGGSFCESADFGDNTVVLPASLQTIGRNAFFGCSSLKSLNIVSGSRLSSIGTSFCFSCDSLIDIYISNNVDISGAFAPGSDPFMSQKTKAAYLAGIKCHGDSASALMAAFPDTTSGTSGRKWRTE